MALHRRRLLELCGTTASVGLAGCLGDSVPIGNENGNGNTGGGPTDEDIENGTVDYPGMVDGAATVSTEEHVTIEYEDPETQFSIRAIYEGEEGTDGVAVQRDLSGETMAAFVAPVHADGGFEYHVFANAAFVDFADWNAVAITESGLESLETPGFERVEGPIYRAVLAPGEVSGLAVTDATVEELQGSSETVTAIAIRKGSTGSPEPSAPQIAFGFEYDAESERLTVQHEGGDNVEAPRLDIRSDADIAVESGFEGTVSAGDTATVSVPGDAVVRIVWTDESGDLSAVLAQWQGPEA